MDLEIIRSTAEAREADAPSNRSHLCQACGKTLARREPWLRHKSIHAGEERHICPNCQQAFSWANILLQHRRVVHDESGGNIEARRPGTMSGHYTNGGESATSVGNSFVAQLQAASRSHTTTPVNLNNGGSRWQPLPEAPRYPAQPHGLPIVGPSRAMATMRMCSICGQLFESSSLRQHQGRCGLKLRCQRLNGCGREFDTVRQLSEHSCHKHTSLQSLIGILDSQSKANGQQQQPCHTQQTPRMHLETNKETIPTPAMADPTPAMADSAPAVVYKSTINAQNATALPSGSKYTDEENALLKQLRDVEGRDWSEICKHFPGRTAGSIRVHWYRKLKDKPVDEVISGAPGRTGPASIAPGRTDPASTGAASTGAASTGAASTGAASTGAASTGAASTGAASIAPASIAPAYIAPASTGPASTARASIAPASIAPASTAPEVIEARSVLNPQLSAAVAVTKTTTENTPSKGKSKNPDASKMHTKMHGGRYTAREQLLIKKWKEEDKLSWEAMHEHLPARAPMSIQVHYYTKLKNITKEELQKRVEDSRNDGPPRKRPKTAEAEDETLWPRKSKQKPTLVSQMSDVPAAPSSAVQKLLVSLARKHPEARPLPPREIASMRNNLAEATKQGKLMPFGTDRCIRALDNLLGRRVGKQSSRCAADTPAAIDLESLKMNGLPESKPDDLTQNEARNQREDGPRSVVETVSGPAVTSTVDPVPSIELGDLLEPKTGTEVIELSDSSEDEKGSDNVPRQQAQNHVTNNEKHCVDSLQDRQTGQIQRALQVSKESSIGKGQPQQQQQKKKPVNPDESGIGGQVMEVD